MSVPTPTVIAIVVREHSDGPRVLVQERTNPKDANQRSGPVWEFPQGKFRDEIGPSEAAIREVRQEAGIDARVPGGLFATSLGTEGATWIDQRSGPALLSTAPEHRLTLPVLLVAPSEAVPVDTAEARNHRWVSCSELSQLLVGEDWHPAARYFAHYWLSEQSHPTRDDVVRFRRLGIRRRPHLKGRPTVCVDVGGVLLQPTTKHLTASLAGLYQISQEAVQSVVMSRGGLADLMNLGSVPPKNVHSALCDRSALRVDLEAFENTWCDSLIDRPANVETIRSLREEFNEIQWCYATNVDPMKHHRLIETRDWYAELDFCIASFEVGIAKPDASFYQTTASAAGCARDEQFLIDDKPANRSSAEMSGMSTFSFDRADPLDRQALRSALATWIGGRT